LPELQPFFFQIIKLKPKPANSWKMFLPQKWKDPKIALQKSTEFIMDPNLTVAHVTHNASMILLHQLIAYPPATWTWASRLPSRYSADTCKAAAVEIATIAQNYLASATTTKVISNQFVFCLYVAARCLLGKQDSILHKAFTYTIKFIGVITQGPALFLSLRH
jgi:hypothetical protein